jgi:hypothetical protein
VLPSPIETIAESVGTESDNEDEDVSSVESKPQAQSALERLRAKIVNNSSLHNSSSHDWSRATSAAL